MNKMNVLMVTLAVLSIAAAPPARQAAMQPCLVAGSWRIISIQGTNDKGEVRNELKHGGEAYLIVTAKTLHFLQEDSTKIRDPNEYEIVRLNHNQDGWLDVWEPGAAVKERVRTLYRFTNGRLLLAVNEKDENTRPTSFAENDITRMELIPERPDRLIRNHIAFPDVDSNARLKKDAPRKK